MRKLTIILVLLIASSCLSCESTTSIENRVLSKTQPSSTATPEEKQYNRNWEHHYNEALKFRAAGKIAEAIEEFKKAIKDGNDDKEIYREIARLLILLKRYEEAEGVLRKILEKDSEDAMAHWALAEILVENLDRYEEGLREAVLSEKFYGDDGLSYIRSRVIGKAYDGLKDYDNAIKHYKIFLKESSYAPDTNDYKEIQKRLFELQKTNPN